MSLYRVIYKNKDKVYTPLTPNLSNSLNQVQFVDITPFWCKDFQYKD